MSEALHRRVSEALAQREREGTLRALRVHDPFAPVLNLSDNDYLALAQDPQLTAIARERSARWPLSASASPLVSGYFPCHADFENALAGAYGFPAALLWTGGYTANAGLLGALIGKDDLIFCDRLIHRSMIAGMQHCGARFFRFRHNDTAHLETLLAANPAAAGQTRWLLTESVYSMDGDTPDMRALADIRRRHDLVWALDEAHALGWYGPTGLGLAEETGVLADVDILVGTLGKSLAAQGAFTLLRQPLWRTYLVNFAPEFIYATYLSPQTAAQAHAAWQYARTLAPDNKIWRARSAAFRQALRADGWDVPAGDSPIVPVLAGSQMRLERLRAALAQAGILAGAIRPPTVPKGTARLRLSLKRTFDETLAQRVRTVLKPFVHEATS